MSKNEVVACIKHFDRVNKDKTEGDDGTVLNMLLSNIQTIAQYLRESAHV